jgi:hypothetical protein
VVAVSLSQYDAVHTEAAQACDNTLSCACLFRDRLGHHA